MRKSLPLTEEEVQWLLTRLGDDPFRLRGPLNYMLKQMSDDAERLKEITARHRANQHWVAIKDDEEIPGPPAKKTKSKDRMIDDAIAKAALLPQAEKDALLKALRGEHG